MYRHRRALLACLTGAASVLTLASCLPDDGQSGIPTQASTTRSATASPSPAESQSPAATAAPEVPIGAVPSNPAAARALQPWAADLVTGDLEVLTRKCWTVPPLEIPTMYGDKDSVLAALAEPGVDGQYAVTWTGPGVTVAVKRSEIASGYACPRVYATGSNGDFTPADARHVVRRYLSRLVGTPLSPDDVEGAYPLVCSAAQTWDPEGTGNPIAPPFATNSNLLTGTKAFVGDDIESTPLQLDYLSVTVPITNAAGVTATKDFTLRIGSEGYCIGDMSA